MLIGIPKILSPELLKILCEMGHGDEIVLADGNFPAASNAKRLVRADGINIPDMLSAILSVMPLDQYDDNHFVLMEKCEGDPADTSVWDEYRKELDKVSPDTEMSFSERFAFYERAREAYAIVACGESRQYANIILKKGCIIE